MRHSIRAAHRGTALPAAAALAVAVVLALPGAAFATPVIVNLANGADAASVAASVGVVPVVVLEDDGVAFAADVSVAQLKRLQTSSRIDSIEHDPVVARIAAAGPDQPAQLVKVAQKRIGLLESVTASVDGRNNPPINVDIAVFDTGVDKHHPDLTVAGGVDCAANKGWWDRDGHGTMVAGLAAAKDNRIGVVGVAPGARIWSVRIADPDNNIRNSSLRCGLEWLNKRSKTIEVANFSFSEGDPYVGPCGVVNGVVVDRIHKLTCKAVKAGVTIVGSAGNDTIDAGTVSPSAWPEVIAVSATAETDGVAGGLGPVPCLAGELDDHIATFSNFGSAVDIAAPGVCVTSTYPGGQYAFDSGTSFSAPLVSGAAALVIAKRPRSSPEAVRSSLLGAAEPGPIPGDSDGFAEGILNVATF